MNLSKIALAIDSSDQSFITSLLGMLTPSPQIIKLGLQAVTALGLQEALSTVREVCPDADIFLDLKLHDIPNTVAKAVENIGDLGVKYLTIHSLGGTQMISEAIKASEGRVNLVAVTVLTSLSASDTLGMTGCSRQVLSENLSQVAYDAGARWFVASAEECPTLKNTLNGVQVITPGIRPVGAPTHDQSQVMTPDKALQNGSDMLVIGRPIYQADDPQTVWSQVVQGN